jgi:hypothetical protein
MDDKYKKVPGMPGEKDCINLPYSHDKSPDGQILISDSGRYANWPSKIPFKWEPIDRTCVRAKVMGGWVFCTFSKHSENTFTESSVFISDPFHQWEIE